MSENFFDIPSDLLRLADEAENECAEAFRRINEISRHNCQKVLRSFIDNGISESHFAPSTGYGYNDRGRDAFEQVVAQSFGAQDALARYNFVSGTHTLTVALFGMLRPGDVMLCVTGKPYDTLLGVIGHERQCAGSLAEYGIGYRQLDLLPDGSIDTEKFAQAITPEVKMVYIQRSRGYSLRRSLPVDEIGRAAKAAHAVREDVIVMVDNCYGEFVDTKEPVAVGADVMAGSFLKNPGGGIAPTGGYIAGRSDLVEMCSYRLTTPGTGKEIGCTLGHTREMFMGFFSAPSVVANALKTAVFCSALFKKLGFEVSPEPKEARADIIQTVSLQNRENLIAFCRGVQSGSAVDSAALPEPDAMPGYDCDIIMASGSFTLGSSIELSADAPLREPFAVYMQGGICFDSARVGILLAAKEVLKKDI